MAIVANFFSNVIKAIPVLIAKVGTVLLLIFTVGMAAGYFMAVGGFSPVVFLVPVLAMLVMWYRLDEGVFALVLLALLVFFFPDVVNLIFSAALG